MNYLKAKQIAESAMVLLQSKVEKIVIAGSVRRGVGEVKDIEVVVLPAHGFDALMLNLVERNVFYWAAYNGANEKTTYRRGPKYYGVAYQRARLEVFTCTKDNLGYILWLRTGPAEANTFLMTHLPKLGFPYQFRDGFVWDGDNKLCIPDEAALFDLMGIEYLALDERTPQAYRELLQSDGHQWGEPVYVDGLQQLSLF